MPLKDYYKTLGVSEKASDADIKSAFRKLAKEYHPDRNPGNRDAEAKFKEINEAHEHLSNKEKRARYDQMKDAAARGYDFSGMGGGARPGQGGYTQYNGNVDMSDIFEMFSGKKGAGGFQGGFGGGLGDIFDMFMNQGRGAQQEEAPQISPDVTVRIVIPFNLALNGGETIIKVPRQGACAHCSGTGSESGSGSQVCPMCSGRGMIQFAQGNYILSKTCPRCGGRGRIAGAECRQCNGTSVNEETAKIRVKIPEGTENGLKIKIKGQGNEINGKKGNLFVIFNVKNDSIYRRTGDDIYLDFKIKDTIAKKGGNAQVDLPQGGKIVLKIPAGSEKGKEFRIKGKGAKNVHTGRNGDFYIKINY